MECTKFTGRANINLYCGDCNIAMSGMDAGRYDLAIVDPPYFKTGGDPTYYKPRCAKSASIKPITAGWKLPDKKYFTKLYEVSQNQIIWGCNYFSEFIPHPARMVWHKETGGDFSDCEIASYSKTKRVVYYRYRWNGMIQENMKNKELRHHPTQKPVALYKWLLTNYAKPGDTILDTHGGSMSIAIAAWDLGFDLDLYELDKDYYRAGVERVRRHTAQMQLEI